MLLCSFSPHRGFFSPGLFCNPLADLVVLQNKSYYYCGDCVNVGSFLTCQLIFQLFKPDVFPFETRSVFLGRTGKTTKNQLKLSEKIVLRGLRQHRLIFDHPINISTF